MTLMWWEWLIVWVLWAPVLLAVLVVRARWVLWRRRKRARARARAHGGLVEIPPGHRRLP